MPNTFVIAVFLAARAACFRPAVDNEVESAARRPSARNDSDCAPEKLELLQNVEALRRQGLFRPICGRTPLELAVFKGWTQTVEALFEEPELAGGMAELRLRLNVVARHLPHWPREPKAASAAAAELPNPDGLDVLRRVVPPDLKPKDQEIIGDMPYNWLTLYEIKVMCLNAHATYNISSQRAMEVVLASQGFDGFARNYSFNAIFLSLIFFCFGLMVYVSFRLRAFGWLDVPVSLAEMLPGAFPPERLTDADFDPSRQKKQLPYRRVQQSSRQLGMSESFSNGFQAIFGIYTSWLLLCIRIPPEKDGFDEEYMTDDDEDCRLKVRDVCAMRAKNVGSIEVIVRALSLCALHYWLICAGRYADLCFLDFLYLIYAWLVATVATSVPEQVELDAEVTDQGDDPATYVTGIFGVQHGPRWTRAQCTTRSTAAPNKGKRRQRRRRDQSSGNEGKTGKGEKEKEEGPNEGPKEVEDKEEKDDKEEKEEKDDKAEKDEKAEKAEKAEKDEKDEKDENADKDDTAEKARKEATDEQSPRAPAQVPQDEAKSPEAPAATNFEAAGSFSDRFQRLLLNAGIMHINHSSLLELTVVSICSCFLAVVFLLHLRWMATGSFSRFYQHVQALELVQAYGLADSFDRALAMVAEMLLLWLCFERLYDMSSLLHATTLTFKQRNASLRFLREHPPPGRELNLSQARAYCEEVARCSEFALELSDLRWRILQKPVEFLVSMVETLLSVAFLLILIPMLIPFLPNFQVPGMKHQDLSFLWAFLDPVVPLTMALVLVSPTVHMLLQAHFANGEIQRQQDILRGRADLALSKSPLKPEEDVEYVQLRNDSRKAFAKGLVRWSHDRVLGVIEPIMVLYSALLVVGLATISRLNFIII